MGLIAASGCLPSHRGWISSSAACRCFPSRDPQVSAWHFASDSPDWIQVPGHGDALGGESKINIRESKFQDFEEVEGEIKGMWPGVTC